MHGFSHNRPSRAKPFIILFAICLLASRASVAEENDSLHYAGTVDIDQTRISFLVSGHAGGGVLHYQGHDYPFSISGLGVGGIGVTKLTAKGDVYNLPSAAQFPGMYSQFRTGVALGDNGGGKLWLKNGQGVVLKLRGTSQGIGLTMGADAVHVTYK
jgi:hypothetical protein